MVLLKVVPHNLFISPIKFFSKNRGFSWKIRWSIHWLWRWLFHFLFHFLPEPNSSIGSYVREKGGEAGLITALITAGVWSGFLRTGHRRCKLCTLLQRDCAVEGEREEEAPFHSLPAELLQSSKCRQSLELLHPRSSSQHLALRVRAGSCTQLSPRNKFSTSAAAAAAVKAVDIFLLCSKVRVFSTVICVHAIFFPVVSSTMLCGASCKLQKQLILIMHEKSYLVYMYVCVCVCSCHKCGVWVVV